MIESVGGQSEINTLLQRVKYTIPCNFAIYKG